MIESNPAIDKAFADIKSAIEKAQSIALCEVVDATARIDVATRSLQSSIKTCEPNVKEAIALLYSACALPESALEEIADKIREINAGEGNP